MAWQTTCGSAIALGPDKGNGGKYLFLPPGDKGDVPDGYFVVKSPTYRVWIPFRNFAVDGDVKPALESLKKHMRIYPLNKACKKHGEVPSKNGSPNGAVQQNKYGSTDVYLGPKPPAGKKANWIQTVPGRGWCTILRLYSPKQPWFDKTWRPGEIVLVK